jgi:competence/damage-inducible protein CinA-like protein
MNAEILTIGTELLLGEISDTNTRVIARALRDLGLDLYRTVTVGDNVERIAAAVCESVGRSRILITTGGLGPTVDDPTREAIAKAAGVELEFRPELWTQIQERFARYGRLPTENNRRQAFIPAGAIPVENPVGTAPAFIVEVGEASVIALPGVPEEMAALLSGAVVPYLTRRFGLQGTIRTRILRTAGLGESAVDEKIGDLERLANPTVGLSAHPGRVDIRVAAKSADRTEAEALIKPVEAEIRARLGEAIYGADEETLEDAAIKGLLRKRWRLATVEHGTGGALSAGFAAAEGAFAGGDVFSTPSDADALRAEVARAREARAADAALGIALTREGVRHQLAICLITPEEEEARSPSYGGAPHNAVRWAVTLALDLLRRRLH